MSIDTLVEQLTTERDDARREASALRATVWTRIPDVAWSAVRDLCLRDGRPEAVANAYGDAVRFALEQWIDNPEGMAAAVAVRRVRKAKLSDTSSGEELAAYTAIVPEEHSLQHERPA